MNFKRIIASLMIIILFFISVERSSYAITDFSTNQDRIWVTNITYYSNSDIDSITYSKNNNNYIYSGRLYSYRKVERNSGGYLIYFQGWLYNTGIGSN